MKIKLNQMVPIYTGFLIEDARFSKLKNISYLLSDEEEGKIKENMDKNILAIGHL